MINTDENGGGGELSKNEVSPRIPGGRGRDRYWTRQELTRHAAAGSEQRAGAQANCTDDVIEKNDGPQIEARQKSARRLTYLRHNHRGLAVCASRVLNSRTGIPNSRPRSTKSRRTVKQTRGATVDSCISMWKVALMIFIYSLQEVSLQSTSCLSAVYKMFICSLLEVSRQATRCLPAVYRLSTCSL